MLVFSDSFRAFLAQFGTVSGPSGCTIIRDRHSGLSRGFGFVTYENERFVLCSSLMCDDCLTSSDATKLLDLMNSDDPARLELDGSRVRSDSDSSIVSHFFAFTCYSFVFRLNQVRVKLALAKNEISETDAHATKIFVGGLTEGISNGIQIAPFIFMFRFYGGRADILRQYFSKFGVVSECYVVYDHQTNRSRGFGTII